MVKQFHTVSLTLTKEILERLLQGEPISKEIAKGVELEVQAVENLLPRYEGIKLESEHTVVITSADLAELEKTQWLNNTFRGQAQTVRYLPPRDNEPSPKKTKKTPEK